MKTRCQVRRYIDQVLLVSSLSFYFKDAFMTSHLSKADKTVMMGAPDTDHPNHLSEHEASLKGPVVEPVASRVSNPSAQHELSKNFNWTSMLATCVSLMSTWEAFCSTMAAGLISGGPVSLVYGFIGMLIC